jgi:uncharacterized repeat protein (TIGR03803 family)
MRYTALSGLAATFGLALMAISASAQGVFANLYSFPTSVPFYERSGLIRGIDGNLYGSSSYSTDGSGGGFLFKVAPNGAVTDLFDFTNAIGLYEPQPALVQGADGTLYGATMYGGLYSNGAVFRINPDGTGFEDIHDFGANPYQDPVAPGAGLILGKDGMLYGTTQYGGTWNGGTAYRLNTDGSGFSILHSFGEGGWGVGGIFPLAPLTQASNGLLYGTTQTSGLYKGTGNPAGVVFSMNPDGSGYTELHTFYTGTDDGMEPLGPVVQGADGSLYGTTQSGGTNGYGIVYRMGLGGDTNTVYSFTEADGGFPLGGLVLASDGNLYGTAEGENETALAGSIFSISPNGDYNVVYSFTVGGADGANPIGTPVEGFDGAIYGTTTSGADFGGGGIYRISGLILNGFSAAISVPGVYAVAGVPVPISAQILASDGSTPAGLTLNFELDGTGIGTATTGPNGWATLLATPPANLKKGTHTITVSFAGNPLYGPAAGTGILSTAAHAGILTLALHGTTGTAQHPLYVDGSNSAKIVATLKGGAAGNTKLAGQTIVFTAGLTQYKATTDSNGEATVTYSAPKFSAPGTVKVTATYAGSSNASTCAASPLPVVEDKIGATVSVSAASGKHGHAATLSAKIKLATGGGLTGQTLTFQLNGQTASGVTGANGVASVSMVLPSTPGTYPINASYAGNSTYKAASGQGTATVK